MPGDPRRKLAVDIETVVRQQHDELRTFLARLLDIGAHIFLADTERPFRHQPARICDRRIRKRLAEHRDLYAAFFEQFHRLERRLVPFGVADVEREEGKTELP